MVSNPSERLLDYFRATPPPGHDLTLCPLPTSFARAPALLQAALAAGGTGGQAFDVVLMLGVATGSPFWRVERVGRNRDAALADVDGFAPPERVIIPDAPEALPVTWPVEALVTRLEQIGLPVAASDSAGAYLCNHLLFTTLYHLQQTGHPARAGFLHIPADEQTFEQGLTSAPIFPFTQHVEAVRAVLDALTEPTLWEPSI